MTEQRYVLLRTEKPPKTREVLGVLPSAMAESVDAASVSVEAADLSRADAVDARRDPRTVGMAPSLPLALVAPVTFEDPQEETAAAAAAVPDAAEGGTTWGIEAIGANRSSMTRTGAGVTVAVLDTGIDMGHDSFRPIQDRIVFRDFTGLGAGDGPSSHGTHCAGTVFGQDVQGARIGVARGVEKALIGRVLGNRAGTDALIAAIEWATDEGAHVISMSLGFDFPASVEWHMNVQGLPLNAATSQVLTAYRQNVELFDALAALTRRKRGRGQGPVIIAATGNEAHRTGTPPYTISASSPAAAEGIIAVGAVFQSQDAGLRVAGFSNTDPRLVGPGVGVESAKAGGGLTKMSGTSMATPHVAGVAALWAEELLQTAGMVRVDDLAARLTGTASRASVDPAMSLSDVGLGLVQCPMSRDPVS